MRPASTDRRVAQGDEIGGVIAEEAADAEQPDRPGLAQGLGRARADGPERDAGEAADAEGQRQKLERRHGAARRGEPGEGAQSRTAQRPMAVAARRERVMRALLADLPMRRRASLD